MSNYSGWRRYAKPLGRRGICQNPDCKNNPANRRQRTTLERDLDMFLGNSSVSGHARLYIERVYKGVAGKRGNGNGVGKIESKGYVPMQERSSTTKLRVRSRGDVFRAANMMTCATCKSMGRSKRSKGKKAKKKKKTTLELLLKSVKGKKNRSEPGSKFYNGITAKVYAAAQRYKQQYQSLTERLRTNYNTNNYALQN